jgi:hypothetical protein
MLQITPLPAEVVVQILTSDKRFKKSAKKFVSNYHELGHAKSLDVLAQMCGYANYHQLRQQRPWNTAPSLRDDLANRFVNWLINNYPDNQTPSDERKSLFADPFLLLLNTGLSLDTYDKHIENFYYYSYGIETEDLKSKYYARLSDDNVRVRSDAAVKIAFTHFTRLAGRLLQDMAFIRDTATPGEGMAVKAPHLNLPKFQSYFFDVWLEEMAHTLRDEDRARLQNHRDNPYALLFLEDEVGRQSHLNGE